MATSEPASTPPSSEEDMITPQDSASQCGSSTSSVSSRAERAANREKRKVRKAAQGKQRALKEKELQTKQRLLDADQSIRQKQFDLEKQKEQLQLEKEQREQDMMEEKEELQLDIEIAEAEAEEAAITRIDGGEATQSTSAQPLITTATTTTTAPPAALSLPPPLSAAAEITSQRQTQEVSGIKFVSNSYVRENSYSRAVAGGAIPKRPPPGIQLPAAGIAPVSGIITSAMDNLREPSASCARVGVRGVDTAVLDTVQPSPALAGGVSAPVPTPGYSQGYFEWINTSVGAGGSGMDTIYSSAKVSQPAVATVSTPPIGYFPESRRYPPTVTYADVNTPTVVTSREQETSAASTGTRLRYRKALHRPARTAHRSPPGPQGYYTHVFWRSDELPTLYQGL